MIIFCENTSHAMLLLSSRIIAPTERTRRYFTLTSSRRRHMSPSEMTQLPELSTFSRRLFRRVTQSTIFSGGRCLAE